MTCIWNLYVAADSKLQPGASLSFTSATSAAVMEKMFVFHRVQFILT